MSNVDPSTGQGCDPYAAFLKPAMERKNLRVLTQAHVSRVSVANEREFVGGWAEGEGVVACMQDPHPHPTRNVTCAQLGWQRSVNADRRPCCFKIQTTAV